LLVLRPQPAAAVTAARARDMGLDPVIAPLFEIRSLPFEPFDAADYDAVLLTSANGARHGSEGLTALPCFAVGEASAAAARLAGFEKVTAGSSDGAAAVAMMARARVRRAAHPCGRDRMALAHPDIRIDSRPVYAAEPLDVAPETFAAPCVALVHSARSARRLAQVVADRSGIAIAAISAAAAQAAGEGWAAKAAAASPRDEALLELAAKLCNHGPGEAEDEHGT
jgi:uroporphyrinogen-III synthase